jgi:antirestriction protein ArdC
MSQPLKLKNRKGSQAMKQDVYTRVTDTILAALEQGARPWMKPWDAAHAAGPVSRPLRHNGTPYKGVNVLMLWLAAMERGYSAPIWMTYDQAKELGGYVRKNEHSSLVVYANTFKKTETDTATGEDMEVEIPFMKPYSVFNVEQIDGLPAHYYAKNTLPALDAAQRQARLDAFFAATGASIRHGGNRAFYTIGEDYIQMPPFETFHSPESYYATLAHEETHWTRHPSRLDRDLGRKKWGDAGYAMEELVAEIGSAFLCAELGITPEIREDHAAYIASWLKVLEEDKRAIFTAASHAQKAADFLLSLQPSPEPEPEPEPNREPAPEPQAQQPEPETGPERPPAPAAVAESPTAADPPVPVGQPFNTASRRADAPPAPATTSAAPARKSPGRRAPRPGQGALF